MTRLRRFVVLLLVALALPLQALAAAAMLHCAPQSLGGAHVHGAEASVLADHGAHGGAPAADDDADAAFEAGAAVHGLHDDHRPHAPAAQGGHACSACAACCTMAGAPAMALGVPSPQPVPATGPEAAAPAVVFLTSGVERPPRARG